MSTDFQTTQQKHNGKTNKVISTEKVYLNNVERQNIFLFSLTGSRQPSSLKTGVFIKIGRLTYLFIRVRCIDIIAFTGGKLELHVQLDK